MTADRDYDVAIIGSGAGGGTLAYSLANTGKRVLLLERGGWLPREKENWDPQEVFTNERYHTSEEWFTSDGKPFRAGTNYFVGGNTKVYGSVLLRMREHDFEAVQHHDGLSPAWPLRYETFAPYYTKAEQLYSVHGQRGSDPTEPPSADPYPEPAIRHEPRIQEVFDGLQAQGLSPFPLPVGVRLNEDEPHLSPCIKCETFDGFPCLVDAKSDAATTCVLPALQHSNVTLLTEAYVARLDTDSTGRRVSSIQVEHGGQAQEFAADIVVVSCGAINSAALLLRSANDKHPTGLANRSDQVGRNYMAHNNTAMLAVSRKPNPSKFTKTLGVNDFYWGADDFDFPLGHIQTLGKSLPAQLESDAPRRKLPGVGRTLEYIAEHSVDWWATTEDLARPENRVTLDAEARIVLSYTPNNTVPHQRLIDRLKKAAEHIDGETHILPQAVYLKKQIPIAGVAHQSGTLRFGTDPDTSVLDVNCKAHDLDNLYAVDSSFFPSSSSINPSLTIIANALRVGDLLRERLR